METFVSKDIPEPKATGTYVVPTLGLSDGTFVFTYLGAFLSYITPQDLPVVNCMMELLRNGFHARLSIVQLIFEALKIESGFICLIAIFFIVSTVPITFLLIWACSSTTNTPIGSQVKYEAHRLESPDTIDGRIVDATIGSLQNIDENISSALHCRRRVLQFFVQVCILLLIASVTTMIVTNEQISTALHKAPDVIRASLKDVEVFLKDVHKQITFSVHEGLSTTVERIKYDLEDIDKLLGDPIQTELAATTGIELSFETILNICSTNSEIKHRIQLMHDSIVKAMLVCQDASQKIDDLQVQLTILQRQCPGRDRPLCDTLRLKGFADNRIMENLIKLQSDGGLYKMLTLGEQDVDGVTKNISYELQLAKENFRSLTKQIKINSSQQWLEIQKELLPMRDATQRASATLSLTVRSLVDTIDRTWSWTIPWLDDLQEFTAQFWLTTLLVAIVTLFISMILMGALSYDCCLLENRSSTVLLIGATTISLGSLVLCFYTVSIMLLGGHGEVFFCRSVFDKSESYAVLGKLFDSPGASVLHQSNFTSYGLFADILKIPMPNRTVNRYNATLSDSIKRCERSGATYDVFQLDALLNLSRIVDYKEYAQLVTAIDKITVTSDRFGSLTDSLQNLFEDMYVNTEVDLSAYRLEMNQPTPERDLSTFIDQMQRVSLQIQDVATSARMVTLGNRARRLHVSVFIPLDQIRNEIVYHLTALELQREPWIHQVNNTLMHLKSTQFYLNKETSNVLFVKTKAFKDRIRNHLLNNRAHLMAELNVRVATCRPLFDIFDAARWLICRHVMDPLNGLWFSGLLCMLLWAVATPLALGLVNIYRRMTCAIGLTHTNSHQAPSDTLIISEQSRWAVNRNDSGRWETANFVFDEDDERSRPNRH